MPTGQPYQRAPPADERLAVHPPRGRARDRDSGCAAAKRQGPQPAQHDPAAEPRAHIEQADVSEPLEQHLEHDPTPKARERSAKAMVDAPPEAQVGANRAADIETIRF